MKTTETPEQKAKRLGLTLVPKIKPIPSSQIDGIKKKQEDKEVEKKVKDDLNKYFKEPIKVCGECGKTITRAEEKTAGNCFRGDCPCNNGVKWTM